ncbi:MAG: glycosyltransferase family 4 protein, partial [Planctomycetaceae bacterium]
MLPPPPKVAYIVKRYPRFSETFVVNEILAHEAANLPLEIFSLRPPVDTHFQDLISRVQSPLTYLSCGKVKARELWDSLTQCAREFGESDSILQRCSDEDILDVYCGLRLAIIAQQRGITHLHAHFASSAAAVARIASLVSGIPYSITAHAKDIFHESVCRTKLAARIQDSTATLTVSDFNVRFLTRTFPQISDRIVRLYNGMHLGDFPFESPQQRAPQIVAVGRFVEKKGFKDLIDACALLRARGVDFVCKLVGGGELEQPLREQIERVQLTAQVQMTGPQPQSEVKKLIHSSAVMAAPCVKGLDGNQDGLPTVLLESMALGTPCISTAVTGIPEVIIHQKSGLIVSQSNPEELADALQQTLHDSELRVRLAGAARALIEREFDAIRNAGILRSIFSGTATPDGISRHTANPEKRAEALATS